MLKLSSDRAKGLKECAKIINGASNDEEIKERLSGRNDAKVLLRAEDVVVVAETQFLFECTFADAGMKGGRFQFFIVADGRFRDWALKMTDPSDKIITHGSVLSESPYTIETMREELFSNGFVVVVD